MSFPKTPLGCFNDLNKRYFEGSLATPEFRIVEAFGEGDYIDTRYDLGSTKRGEDGTWIVSLNKDCLEQPILLYLVLCHEMVHIRIPSCNHGDKKWNAEIRRLQGLGFLKRIF